MPRPDLPPRVPQGGKESGKGAERADDDFCPLDAPALPTDDTPTIISRNAAPRPAVEEATNGIRGRRLAHFELIEPIGVGGMAAVLRARDTQLDRIVALKILPPDMAADPENVLRFHQEARSAAKLDHENIARVFFCGEDQRLHFIAFEFVEGDNLRVIAERRGRLPAAECLHYLLQVTAGLIHASRRGVVHRDIKPSNIIITPAGRAKLVDMGLARSMEARGDKGLTQSGVTLGTFDYISPEQALEPRDADVRSDIYSLGCTFYHMLTGRPPVPEGTAARKLHHHQHVKPADPRHLVAGVPDEVAVLLDRMMAKSPRDRFQTPEELLQAMLAAAQHLGVDAYTPEGVIAVEAELPSRPSGRPLLFVALAALAVVALILLLDGSPPKDVPPVLTASNAPADPAGPRLNLQGDAPAAPGRVVAPVDPPGPSSVTYQPPEVPTMRHLVEWARANADAAQMTVLLPDDLDTSEPGGGAERGLVLRARGKIEIRPYKAGGRSTLRFAYDGTPRGNEARVALTLEAPAVVVRGVRVVVDARVAPDTAMVGLLVQGGKARLEGCEFVQAGPSLASETHRSASVVFQGVKAADELQVRDSSFVGFGERGARGDGGAPSDPDPVGQDALVRRGPGHVEVENCAFGPHSVTFRLEGEGESGPKKLDVRNCSILAARRSAVFGLQKGVSAELSLSQSVVARAEFGPKGATDEADGPALLIHEADGHRGVVKFHGADNRYADLDGYWAVGAAWRRAGWGDFRQRPESSSDSSRILLHRPWEFNAERQRQDLKAERPEVAFRLGTGWSELRQNGLDDKPLLGAQAVLGRPVVPAALPAATASLNAAEGRQLVVDPEGDDARNGVYPTLAAAVERARPGDALLLRHAGPRDAGPIRLDRKELADLTIRPARGFRAGLTLGSTSDREAALFHLHGGLLRLEGLDLLLRPTQPDASVQALIALVGNGECQLTRCVVTLDRKDGEANLALATLAEPGKAMSVALPRRPAGEGPLLKLDGCFVRGDGDLLWSRTNRPCELVAGNTLVALRRSLLNLDVPADSPAPVSGQRVQMTLTDVTTYLGSLIRFAESKDGKGLVPVACKPTGCLFVPAPGARALIQVDAPDTGGKAIREKLTWTPGVNGYGAFATLVDQQAGAEEMPQPPMSPSTWKKDFSQEDGSKHGLKPTWPDVPFTEMEPEQFKVVPEREGVRRPEEKSLGVAVGLLPRLMPG